jgi:hypothetical protein
MNPAEFPFPAVPSTPFHSKAFDMPFITDAKHLPVADMKAGKFLVIPYDDSTAPFGQQQSMQQQENEREPTVRAYWVLEIGLVQRTLLHVVAEHPRAHVCGTPVLGECTG